MTAQPVITRLVDLYDVPALADGQLLVKQGGDLIAIDADSIGGGVLVWSDVAADYLPEDLKASAKPKEFRGPIDPSTVAGVVLNIRDIWDAMQ